MIRTRGPANDEAEAAHDVDGAAVREAAEDCGQRVSGFVPQDVVNTPYRSAAQILG